MTKFIKLTEKQADGKEQPVLLKVENIKSVKMAKGGDTHINMNDNHYFFVKETVPEIEKLLCTT